MEYVLSTAVRVSPGDTLLLRSSLPLGFMRQNQLSIIDAVGGHPLSSEWRAVEGDPHQVAFLIRKGGKARAIRVTDDSDI